ncbi:MAG TPA: hypothetical protein VLH79_11870 [Chthonomonadales bacterium]|nr:hypothetical protein [Chthonomonadales bacterium]
MYSIIGADDKEYGPVEIGVLVEWARQGRVVTQTTILDHATGRRFLACDMAELDAVFRGRPTVAPPVSDHRIAIATRTPGALASRDGIRGMLRFGARCPACGSTRSSVRSEGADRSGFACLSCALAPLTGCLSLLALPFLYFFPRKRRTCLDCGAEW